MGLPSVSMWAQAIPTSCLFFFNTSPCHPATDFPILWVTPLGHPLTFDTADGIIYVTRTKKMEVNYSKQVIKYLSKAPKNIKEKFESAIVEIKTGKGDIIELVGQEGTYRYKFYGYRIIFSIDPIANVLNIIKFAPRGDVYKK